MSRVGWGSVGECGDGWVGCWIWFRLVRTGDNPEDGDSRIWF